MKDSDSALMRRQSRNHRKTLILLFLIDIFLGMSIEEDIFDSHYEMTLRRLEERSHIPGFSLEELHGELKDLTRFEGLDWTGRGDIRSAEIAGAILAYQAFIMRNSEQ